MASGVLESNNELFNNEGFCLKLESFQKINDVSKIFSKNRNISTLKPKNGENPVLVIVVGAPGVGKTTKTRGILRDRGLNYDNFYNVSLDSFVEKIRPYRNTTKKLYNKLQERIASLPNENKSKFYNSSAALLSEFYLPTIMSKNTSFSLPRTERGIGRKIKVFGDPIATRTYNVKKKVVEELGKKEKASEKKEKAAEKKEKAAEGKANESEEKKLICLNDMLKKGLEYGIQNGLNIIYDTTLKQNKDNKNKIQLDIMPMLERAKEHKYTIKIILVTATEKEIQGRIKGRHSEMLKEKIPFIRAINPTLTKIYIIDNKVGFNETKKYFKNFSNYTKKNPETRYSSEDFEFIEVENPQNKSLNKTQKNNNYNKNNNNYRRTFKRLYGNTNNF
jgi:predicted kinase